MNKWADLVIVFLGAMIMGFCFGSLRNYQEVAKRDAEVAKLKAEIAELKQPAGELKSGAYLTPVNCPQDGPAVCKTWPDVNPASAQAPPVNYAIGPDARKLLGRPDCIPGASTVYRGMNREIEINYNCLPSENQMAIPTCTSNDNKIQPVRKDEMRRERTAMFIKFSPYAKFDGSCSVIILDLLNENGQFYEEQKEQQ